MFIGLDIHKRYNQACVMSDSGEIVQEERFMNTAEELNKFLESIPDDSQIVIEACSVWEPIYEHIEEKGFDISLAHPLKTRLISESKVKTDKIDAESLAKLLRLGELPKAHVPDAHIRKLRGIIRHRLALVKLRVKVKNLAHSVLHKAGITIELTNIFGVSGMQFLKEVPLKPHHRFALNHYLSLIENINSLIDETNAYIENQARNIPEIEILNTIPGIGTYSALLLYAEIADAKRFPDAGKLCRYAGITSSVYQSGNTERYGHITKQGNRLIRWILVQCVLKTAMHPNAVRRHYYRLLKRKGSKVAKVASARKLLTYIHIMLTHNVKFEDLRVNSV